MYNSQTLRIDITQDGELIKTFNLAYKEYSDAFWVPFGQYLIETYKDETNILLANAFIATINYNALVMLSGDYPNSPFTALVEDASSLPSTGATLRAIHALHNTTLDLIFDSVYQNVTNGVKVQAKEWRTTPGIRSLEVRYGSEDIIESADVELLQNMPRTIIIMGRVEEHIDIVPLPPVDFAVEARINIINMKAEPITVTDTLDGSTLNTLTFTPGRESGYIGLIPGYRSFFVIYSSVDSVVMFLEGYTEYTLIFTEDKEPMLFVDTIPKVNLGEGMLTFALVGSVNTTDFNVSYNGVTHGPLRTNDVTPHYNSVPCCGSVSFIVGETNVQIPSFDFVQNKVLRIVVVNNGETFVQQLAAYCGEVHVRFLNTLLKGPAAVRLSIEAANVPLVDQVPYGELTEYTQLELQGGLYRFTVTDLDGNYMFTSCTRLNGAHHTLMMIGDAEEGPLKLWTLQDDNGQPAHGATRVRAVYTIPDIFDQNEMVLTATNGNKFTFPAVNYQTVTDYLNMPGSNYLVKLTVESEVIGTVHKAELPAGSVVSFFVLGSANDQVLDIIISIDAQYVDEEPIVIPTAAPVSEPIAQDAAPVRPRTPGVMKVPLVTVHDSPASMIVGTSWPVILVILIFSAM